MASITIRAPVLAFAALAALGLLAPMLGGCVGVVVGGGATAANAALQERGFRGTVNDTVIRTRINALWLDHSVELLQAISMQVTEGRVLLTGQAKDRKMRLDAVRLAWQAEGVGEIINEIQVSKSGGVASYVRDAWISTQLKGKILFDKQVSSINYSIETVGGIVYLMGIAQDQDELDRVTNHARNLQYVKKVVSYVRLKNDARRRKS